MLATVADALAGSGAVALPAVLPIGDTLAAVRRAGEGVVLVIVGPDLPMVERAMLLAAIGPLAMELAPGRRVCALAPTAMAAAADIAAAARFLAGADSTTGQILRIGD